MQGGNETEIHKKNDKKPKNTETKSKAGVRLKIAASHTAHQTVWSSHCVHCVHTCVWSSHCVWSSLSKGSCDRNPVLTIDCFSYLSWNQGKMCLFSKPIQIKSNLRCNRLWIYMFFLAFIGKSACVEIILSWIEGEKISFSRVSLNPPTLPPWGSKTLGMKFSFLSRLQIQLRWEIYLCGANDWGKVVGLQSIVT